jgi:hypothetical protein
MNSELETQLALTESTLQHLLFEQQGDLYTRLVEARAWFNTHGVTGYEIYLEDQWDEYSEGETRIEYILRSLLSKDEMPQAFAYDAYHNHRTEKGVWHLGDYRASHLVVASVQPLLTFIRADQALLVKR